jgi:hypothetical protein
MSFGMKQPMMNHNDKIVKTIFTLIDFQKRKMNFLSLEPFVPSGDNFEGYRQLFQELGFKINWDAGDDVGFEGDGCKFILQKFTNKEFAENFMISVRVSDVNEFWQKINEKQLVKKFGARVQRHADALWQRIEYD